ncbi:MAG TPA: DNA cytosine methyltransferase [Candidatus Dormibacteraeota bacterium]|nr:DNA cytosine methyltransferase [Candidatus Dormibacteraeota bacterium]
MLRGIDLFCGAGGSSAGARAAGFRMVAAFDAWDLAGKVYSDNFPEARFYHSKLEELDASDVAKSLGKVDLLMASPECTNHSPAKGNRPRCEESKDTAFQVVRFAQAIKPRWIVVENVVSMRNWSRYAEFLADLEALGYSIRQQVLNAKDFGVPQSRRRLFISCDREEEPVPIILRPCKIKGAVHVIDQNGTYKYTPLRSKERAKATLQRADRAICELGKSKPFLIVYYGSDHAGGWQKIDAPLRTITTLDRFALVKPEASGHIMRMLQVPELQRAMGLPQSFKLQHGTRRDRIRMMGNAVCAPVMRRVVSALSAGKTKRSSE